MKEYKIKNVLLGPAIALIIGGFLISIFIIILVVVFTSRYRGGIWWSALSIFTVYPFYFFFIMPKLFISKDLIVGLSDDYLTIRGEKHHWSELRYMHCRMPHKLIQGVTFITADDRKIVLTIKNNSKNLDEWKEILQGIVRGFKINNLKPESISNKPSMQRKLKAILITNTIIMACISMLILYFNFHYAAFLFPLFLWCGTSIPLFFELFDRSKLDPLKQIPLD